MEWIQRFISSIRNFGLEKYGRYYGTYKGFVHSVDDPEQRGRLLIECPVVYGKDIYQYWALPKGQYAGNNKGLFALPSKGDNVWISFENGDMTAPIWEYGYWAQNEAIQATQTDSYPDIQAWQYNGLRIELNTTDGALRIIREDGKVIEVNDTGVSLGSVTKSAQPAVLGNNAIDTLNAINDELKALTESLTKINNGLDIFNKSQITAASSAAVLAPLVPAYIALQTITTTEISSLTAIISSLEVITQNDIPNIVSDVVTLD